ncbi:MAG: S-layer homology domain-containing protein, partial [Acidimicrobiaceae bacterium]|nr:S-layer homology domain-containing protein [Acidimicrobiaceae bacterium]
ITDPDFSGAGLMEQFDGTLVTTAFVPATAGNPRPDFRRVGMVLQPDGNIVVAGAAQTNAWSLTLPNLGDDAFPIPDSFATTVTRFTDSVVARYSGNDLVLIGSIIEPNSLLLTGGSKIYPQAFGYSTSGVRGSIVFLPIATNRPVESDLDITVEALGSSTAVEWQNEDNPGDFRITEKTVTIPAGSRFARVAVRITDNADTDRKTIDLRITDGTDQLLRHPTYRNASVSITPSINVQPTPTNPIFTPTPTVPPTTTVPPDTDTEETDGTDDTDTGTDDTGTDDTDTDDTGTDGGVDFTGTDETDVGTDDTDAGSGDGVVQPAGFNDVDAASTHAANIDAIYAAGITEGCSSDPLQYCPNDPLTRAEMATFLVRALDLEPAQPAGFNDVDAASTHAANIDALYAAGITVGCNSDPLRYCPNDLVTRAEMATFLVRALELAEAQPAGFNDVDAASTHAANIDAIYAAGITVGCNSDPLRYCPNDSITRAQMASFLVRALDLPTHSQPRN